MELNQFKSYFLRSVFSFENPFISTQSVIDWMKEQNEQVIVNVEEIAFNQLDNWYFDDNSLRHKSGKFFSIDGIEVKTNSGEINEWRQPIINQPEIGYLGFITKEFNGILYFLMQAKVEPGNVNNVQLSPTLQATKSNYTKVHKGKAPAYLDYFQKAKPQQILLDQLQSEQGARFLRKRNRNIIIRVDDDIEVKDNFVWLTLGQIKSLMNIDNIVNMDTRTVISGISYGTFNRETINLFLGMQNQKKIHSGFIKSTLIEDKSYHNFSEIISFITRLKSDYDLFVRQIPLKELVDWELGERSISRKDKKYFSVIATKVEISNREVFEWTQPMIKPAQKGLCAFIGKKINGVLHFIVQAKLECGNRDIIEFAPTVQCLTGGYQNKKSKETLPFLDYVLNIEKDKIIFDTFQSEEGGRFFREQNRNLLVLAGDEIPLELPEKYIWMTLNQLQVFIQFNNYINIQARSLIAAISFSEISQNNE